MLNLTSGLIRMREKLTPNPHFLRPVPVQPEIGAGREQLDPVQVGHQPGQQVILQIQLEMKAEFPCRRIRWIEPRNQKSARVQILEMVDGLLLFG
jgi:hypothetical protein